MESKFRGLLLIFMLMTNTGLKAQTEKVTRLVVDAPGVALSGVTFEIKIAVVSDEGVKVKSYSDSLQIKGLQIKTDSGIRQATQAFVFREGRVSIPNAVIQETGSHSIKIESGELKSDVRVRVIPGLLSLLPPLFAITLAFLVRQVLLSLFCGVWLGAVFIYDYNLIGGFMKTIDTYIVNSLANSDHAGILIFSLTLGGMVGVISKSGGTQGIVQKLSKFANHPRGGQLATWAMGLLIFFDDYANSLVVGNTMRPFTDRLKISREKLSYIVDSTAAPVASIALISTWIGFQVGLIEQAFSSIGVSLNPYTSFVESIPYASYSILALVFVFLIGLTLRDFGPMKTAEIRASSSGKVLRDGAQPITDSATLDMVADEKTPLRWYNALIPIAVVIFVTLFGLYFDGRGEMGEAAATAPLGQIFGAANSFAVLMWAAFAGLLVASVLAITQKILSLSETTQAAVNGYKSMFLAAMILILAWSIGDICGQLQTANYVIALTKDILSPHLIPFVTFVVSAFIAFSTGTSWATMAILTPIVIPMAYQIPADAGFSSGLSHEILIATIGSVLSGSVLGDHCSPISDTTILSSMASASDHVDHVRTQLPYAIVVGAVASLVGYIPSGWGFSTWISLFAGTGILVAIVFFAGKKTQGAVG